MEAASERRIADTYVSLSKKRENDLKTASDQLQKRKETLPSLTLAASVIDNQQPGLVSLFSAAEQSSVSETVSSTSVRSHWVNPAGDGSAFVPFSKIR